MHGHTLTHYRGTMECGSHSAPGSTVESSFSRAGVFKKHLTEVHSIEQGPPSSYKKVVKSVNRHMTSLRSLPRTTHTHTMSVSRQI